MKTKLHCLFIALVLFASFHQAAAQSANFFRISGPSVTKITAFQPDGTLVWSNAQPGATYTVQIIPFIGGGLFNWLDYIQIPVTNGVNTNQIVDFNPPAGMAFIPAGIFTIGDTLDGEGDAIPTNIYVSAFYMDVNLVSYSQWQLVYNWATNNGYVFDDAGNGKAANQPVQNLDWYDTVAWSNARSQQAGLTPVYYTDTNLTQVYTNAGGAIYAKWTASGYRLPTETEWEKAARGGLSGQRFPWGDTISESQANYSGDSTDYSYDLGPNGNNSIGIVGGTPYTSPVGSFAPNGYGLYDMAGNIFEWCWDLYDGPPYPAGSPYLGGSDPRGPGVGNTRVLRGGDWNWPAYASRCCYRNSFTASGDLPFDFDAFTGFRCVRGH